MKQQPTYIMRDQVRNQTSSLPRQPENRSHYHEQPYFALFGLAIVSYVLAVALLG